MRSTHCNLPVLHRSRVVRIYCGGFPRRHAKALSRVEPSQCGISRRWLIDICRIRCGFPNRWLVLDCLWTANAGHEASSGRPGREARAMDYTIDSELKAQLDEVSIEFRKGDAVA